MALPVMPAESKKEEKNAENADARDKRTRNECRRRKEYQGKQKGKRNCDTTNNNHGDSGGPTSRGRWNMRGQACDDMDGD
jgi:hypothetical protein